MRVFIDPRARISYASYYIKGLYSLFGKSRVSFNMKYFVGLMQTNGVEDFDQYFAFVVNDESGTKRFIIDYRDKNTINKNALKWSHVYGKVNYNKAEIAQEGIDIQSNKIIPVGPNFGIKIWNNPQAFIYLIINYLKCRNLLPVSFRTFLSGYNWQSKRSGYENYRASSTDKNYIFFISTFYKESQNLVTNKFRAAFIRACKNSGIQFEGGLLAAQLNNEFKVFNDVITYNYVKSDEYLRKTQKSAVVFNTPAIWGCFGWKLGEFLAMGKAIVSTPLGNEMPVSLIHGEQIHFVESETEIEHAVQSIVSDQKYRRKLETGAKEYFDKYLAPDIVVKRLIDNLM